ncbi:hypothetical protein [Mesorhizobium sp. M1403]|uniref:hypothetical protein n=1 Tax=Mesorhizobium sp. M1403 TaxID=2957097 RepID=UPI00333C8D19
MVDTHKLAREMEGRGDGGNMDEGGDTPVGEPGNPVDQFLVLVDCIIARRLNLIDASQREWCREFSRSCALCGCSFAYPWKEQIIALAKRRSPFKIDDLGSWRVESL